MRDSSVASGDTGALAARFSLSPGGLGGEEVAACHSRSPPAASAARCPSSIRNLALLSVACPALSCPQLLSSLHRTALSRATQLVWEYLRTCLPSPELQSICQQRHRICGRLVGMQVHGDRLH